MTNADTIASRRDLLIMLIISQSRLQNSDSSVNGQRLRDNNSSIRMNEEFPNSSTAQAIQKFPEKESTMSQCYTKIQEFKNPRKKELQNQLWLVRFKADLRP